MSATVPFEVTLHRFEEWPNFGRTQHTPRRDNFFVDHKTGRGHDPIPRDCDNIGDFLDLGVDRCGLHSGLHVLAQGHTFLAAGPEYFDDHCVSPFQTNRWAVALNT